MDLTKHFGKYVYSEKVMQERLPKDTFKALMKAIRGEAILDPSVADVVASGMKDWALENGATHYTHWFQPLTGVTAEKHDSFIEPVGDGSVITEFSGKQLIKGEPDASSFPNGGIRATFEARGYTAWDITSPAFLKEDNSGNLTLTIPTAFYSYTSEALDKKTPLLRSMEAVNKQTMRLLKALKYTSAKRVTAFVGPEQEYFLIDREYFQKRLDLITTGRTLFGAPSPKGQELEDHYFGAIKDRVSAYMADLDNELWKMGITSKTRHNEVAPNQFEMAPIYGTANVATDHNQLVMETMQRIALRHDLVCLLHEKPFAGVNGSGKHNNWSIGTDDGLQMLLPGNNPHQNEIFLITLAALIKSVDVHADLLRASAATPGNDHRLGANEAPPAIISIFMGKELTEILEKIEKGEKATGLNSGFLTVGVDSLPPIPKDNSDRNRTSPFAFTGNKFEFRMVGSSASISGPNIVLNTIVAEQFDDFSTRLEKASDVNAEAQNIIRECLKNHKRIIFNGNGYSQDWVVEAEKRGLGNVKSTAGALKAFNTPKAKALFSKYNILSEVELHSRFEIYSEQYATQINIEGKTASNMARRLYIPAVLAYQSELALNIKSLKDIGADASVSEKQLKALTTHINSAVTKLEKLEENRIKGTQISEASEKAAYYRDNVFAMILDLRKDIDAMELILPSELWPVPSYAEMLLNM